jgi:hypothetical protein
MRAETMSRKLRQLRYYKVEVAGSHVGLKRTQSYEAVDAGLIPVERDGKLLLVPKGPWDRRVRKLLKAK